MTFVNPIHIDATRGLQALRAHHWFKELDDRELAPLAAASRWLVYAPGREIFAEGQAIASCLLVVSGCVQGLRYTADGGEKIFGQVRPGGMVSVLSVFMREPRHLHSVRAVEAGEGCLLDAAVFRRLCEANASLACRVLRHSADLVRHHTDQIDWLTSSSAEERLAEYLLRVGKPRAQEPVELPLTHSQIAIKLGMRAETLSRVLAKWRRQGWISDQRGVLRVLDVDYLKRLADTCKTAL